LNGQDDSQYSWKVHPLRSEPGKSVLLVVAIVAVLFAVYCVYENAFWTFLSAGLLFISLAGFFLPTHYDLDDKGVTVSRLGRSYHLAWSRYRTFCVDRRGVLLSPFEGPNRLENFRGNFLLVEQEDRPNVVACVRKYLGEMEVGS